MSMQLLKEQLRTLNAAALILSEENIRYFTSFPASNGILFVTCDTAIYWTDSRYIEAAQAQVKDCDDILLLQDFSLSVLPIIKKSGCKTILVEGERMTVSCFNAYREKLPEATFRADALDDVINHIRAVKRQEEVDCVVKAQRIAEDALHRLVPKIKAGAVERELQLELDYTMLKLGAEALSFETILVSGKNTSLPHGVPTDKKIENGDFVTIDFGATYNGYHSDMTRTFAVGFASDKMHEIYQTVLDAQNAGLAALRPGVACKAVDAVSRDFIASKGYGDYFGHGLGHGVGVEIHEFPVLNPKSDWLLSEGHIVTVEPGIYLPGDCGVRIEDMALITSDGCHNLTLYEKDHLIIL